MRLSPLGSGHIPPVRKIQNARHPGRAERHHHFEPTERRSYLTKHYKTTTSTDSGTTDGGGNATIDFNISGATAGYTVVVNASVGATNCRTSYTQLITARHEGA
jgi:hypothetical protein